MLHINTGKTDRSYEQNHVTGIFALSRTAEDERTEKSLGNRRLLWHGTGIGNLISILNRGLVVAPPEAGQAGTMFGKVCHAYIFIFSLF